MSTCFNIQKYTLRGGAYPPLNNSFMDFNE